MNVLAKPRITTSEQLFKLRPSKKVDRWLFRGEMRETKVTRRNPAHCVTTTHVAVLLHNWNLTKPEPRCKVYTGEIYFRVRQNPETNFGIDVAVATPDQVAKTKRRSSYIDGPPLLAVEILSPSDKVQEIDEKIQEYLECGVARIWVINPYDETLALYQRGHEPKLFSASEEYANDTALPGLKFKIGELFS